MNAFRTQTNPRREGLGIYFHWPWCESICPYCDFNVHLARSLDEARWRDAFLKQLDWFAAHTGQLATTSIYFGGGTPSLMTATLVRTLIKAVESRFKTSADIEITLEANPSGLDPRHWGQLHDAGVNRLSLGVQAFDDDSLGFLGRDHSAEQAEAALSAARKIFPRLSFDIIYGLPEQTVDSWVSSLHKILSHAVLGGHLSLYQLTIEPGTRFFKLQSNGKITIPGEDTLADMFSVAQDLTSAEGLIPYEISNHALEGHESMHNLGYWRYNEYIGVGPGAHSRLLVQGKYLAIEQLRAPKKWLSEVESHTHGGMLKQNLDQKTIAIEILLAGLRLKEGVSGEKFQLYTGMSLEQLLSDSNVRLLFDHQLIEWSGYTLTATQTGRRLLNKVIQQLSTALESMN